MESKTISSKEAAKVNSASTVSTLSAAYTSTPTSTKATSSSTVSVTNVSTHSSTNVISASTHSVTNTTSTSKKEQKHWQGSTNTKTRNRYKEKYDYVFVDVDPSGKVQIPPSSLWCVICDCPVYATKDACDKHVNGQGKEDSVHKKNKNALDRRCALKESTPIEMFLKKKSSVYTEKNLKIPTLEECRDPEKPLIFDPLTYVTLILNRKGISPEIVPFLADPRFLSYLLQLSSCGLATPHGIRRRLGYGLGLSDKLCYSFLNSYKIPISLVGDSTSSKKHSRKTNAICFATGEFDFLAKVDIIEEGSFDSIFYSNKMLDSIEKAPIDPRAVRNIRTDGDRAAIGGAKQVKEFLEKKYNTLVILTICSTHSLARVSNHILSANNGLDILKVFNSLRLQFLKENSSSVKKKEFLEEVGFLPSVFDYNKVRFGTILSCVCVVGTPKNYLALKNYIKSNVNLESLNKEDENGRNRGKQLQIFLTKKFGDYIALISKEFSSLQELIIFSETQHLYKESEKDLIRFCSSLSNLADNIDEKGRLRHMFIGKETVVNTCVKEITAAVNILNELIECGSLFRVMKRDFSNEGDLVKDEVKNILSLKRIYKRLPFVDIAELGMEITSFKGVFSSFFKQRGYSTFLKGETDYLNFRNNDFEKNNGYDFWISLKDNFPILRDYFLTILTTPISAALIERVFSKYADVCRPIKMSTLPENHEQILRAKHNLDNILPVEKIIYEEYKERVETKWKEDFALKKEKIDKSLARSRACLEKTLKRRK